MKVLITANVPSPYMIGFCEELGKLCDLTVVFERAESTERGERWNRYSFTSFHGIILRGINIPPDQAISPQIIKYISVQYDWIVVTNQSTPTGIIAITYMKLRGFRYVLESEGGFPKNGKGFKECLKRYIIRGAYAYFSTTPKADMYFLAYGAPQEKIVHYPFTSLYDREIMKKTIPEEQQYQLRKRLSLKGEKIAIAVGRLIPLKRFEDAIMAWQNMPPEWSLYFAGEGEQEEKLIKLINNLHLSNVFLLGYKDKEQLLDYYKASDILIHPTSTDVWGLIINEAMANGLPIVTTEMCIAGDALVENDVNGYIVKVGDIDGIRNATKSILENEERLRIFKANSIRKIQEYSYERMAEVHMEYFNSKGKR